MKAYKRPISVLVVIHTPTLDILLLERSSHPGYWQSVTGSHEANETLIDTARREVKEETGLDTAAFSLKDWQQNQSFEIFPEWRHRYAPGITHNTEHVFSLEVPAPQPVTISPAEHVSYKWVPWQAAAELCFSWSNRDAILALAKTMTPQGTLP
jgi:dihydroneopterin triphosphate diphosphatase